MDKCNNHWASKFYQFYNKTFIAIVTIPLAGNNNTSFIFQHFQFIDDVACSALNCASTCLPITCNKYAIIVTVKVKSWDNTFYYLRTAPSNIFVADNRCRLWPPLIIWERSLVIIIENSKIFIIIHSWYVSLKVSLNKMSRNDEEWRRKETL